MFQRDIKSRFNIQNYLTDTLKIRGTLCCKEFYIYIYTYISPSGSNILSVLYFFSIFLLSVSHTYVVLFLFLHLLFQHRLPDLVMYLFYSTYLIVYTYVYYIYIFIFKFIYYIFFIPGISLLDHKFYTAHVHWILRSINLTNGLYLLAYTGVERKFKYTFFTIIYFHKFRKTFDQPQCMSLPLLSFLSLSLTISFSISPHTS